jgi:phospholipase C
MDDRTQTSHLLPFSAFSADLASGSLPDFAYIAPNVDDDAHNAPLAQADAWLRANLDPLLHSPAFQNGGLLIITFDESEVSDTRQVGGRVATVIVSPRCKPGYRSTALYQHQSTLRLILESLGITQFPGAAGTAPSMNEFFQ